MSADATNRQLTQLAQLLIDHPTVVLSGERIAGQLGVTRSTVWRVIEQLRSFGVQVRGHPTGYQLESVPDLLMASVIAPHLRSGVFGGRIHHFFHIDSTQQAALQAARAGEPHGALFIAEEQSAGRGRQGHQWHSPPASGMYFTLLLRPDAPPASVLPLTLGAGLAVRDAIRDVTRLGCDIRWPNDLLASEKKCAGILLEMSAEATRIQHAALGIGINVNQTEFPPELSGIATSLRIELASPVSRVMLLVEVLRQLEYRYQQFSEGGDTDLLREFERASSYARGRRVSVSSEGMSGITRGLDGFGFLLIETGDGRIVTVTHGDVRPA